MVMSAETEAGGVRISLPAIYGEVVSTKESMARLSAVMEKHIAMTEQRDKGVEERLENHGTRLADLGSQQTVIDARVSNLETKVEVMQASQAIIQGATDKREGRKATWPQTVGAIGVILTGAVTIGGVMLAIGQLAETLARIG